MTTIRRVLVPLPLLILLSPFAAFGHVEITRFEVNQAIGVQKNGALKFVAGKDTVIRIFLADAVTIEPAQTRLSVVRDGNPVTTLAPRSTEGGVSVVDFFCPSRDACGGWAAGSYTFEATINGVTASTAGTEYRFTERGTIRILALPVKANYGGTIVPVTDSRWRTFSDFIRNTYPVAPDRLIWSTREDFDASDGSFDLETDQGRFNLWEALAKLIPPECAATPNADGCYNQVFGFIMSRPNGYPNGNLQGYTYGKPANIGVITDEDAPATVAHEIGHTFGLGDTYDGGSFNCGVNPAPDAFSGKNFNNPEMQTKCSSGRVPLEGVSGTKIPAQHHPYDVGGRGALPDTAEYMGSGGSQAQFWTTQDAWDWLFDKLTPTPTEGSLSSLRVKGAASEERFIQCFGTIRKNALTSSDVQIDPCWSYLDTDPLPSTTGRYMLAAVNSSGGRLATGSLDPEFNPVGPKGLPSTPQDMAAFATELSFPSGTVKFQVIRDEIVVSEIPVSANPPVLSNIAPEAVGTVNGVVTITWNASDADANRLVYDVEFNPDVSDPESEWSLLLRDVDVPRFTIDFGDMPGGPQARLRIAATDGIHTVEAESGPFIVAAKPPEVIVEDPGRRGYEVGETIILDGDAYDLQDDDILESQLVWSSNIAGPLGTGTPLVVSSLARGVHRITLSVTNSEGLTGTDEIVIVVGESRRRAVRK